MVNERMFALGARKSCIRELFEYGIQQAAVVGKENILDFSIGNPSVPAPKEVEEAFLSVLRDMDSLRLHGYTTAAGLPDAREAIAADLRTRYATELRKENFFLTCGAAPALVSVIRALAVHQAEMLAIAPYFPEYRLFMEENGVKFVHVPADTEHFQIPLDALAARITAHTQAVVINSPNNPSGAIYRKEGLETLAELLTQASARVGHPIYLIADEPYRELVYDGAEASFIPDLYANTIVCYSYSKSLSLPGERIGYVCVPDRVADSSRVLSAVMGAARASGHVCAPSLQQYVIARCAGCRPNLTTYDRNRKILYDALTAQGYSCVRPEGAFYMFVKAPGGDAKQFSDLCRRENLLVVPGGDFGCPEYFRISTCVAEDVVRRSLPVFEKVFRLCREETDSSSYVCGIPRMPFAAAAMKPLKSF